MRLFSFPLLGLLLVCGMVNKPAEAKAAGTGSRLSSIPVSFQGEWRPDHDQCSDMSEYGLDLDARKVSHYSRSGPAKSIRQTTPHSIVVTYIASEAEFGSSEDRTVTFEVSADGRTLTETDAKGDRIHRVRCGTSGAQSAAVRPALIEVDSLIGEWEDGGPACASIRRGRTATSIVFRAWYCEAGERSATPITLERLGDRVFTHRAGDLNMIAHSVRMMSADAGSRSRNQFGDGLYLTEAGRMYNKKSTASESSAQAANPAQLPQLHTGAYVSFPTRCAQASNATLEWWNGQFFSGGRKHPAYPRAVGPARPNGSQPFVADVKGWEDNKTYRVNFLVLSQSMYERDGLRYLHCSDARLNPTWRGSTPPQTTTPQQPVAASARVAGQVDFSSYANPGVGRVFSISTDANLWQLVQAAVPDRRLLARIRDDVGVTLPPEVSGGRLLLWNKCTRLCRDFFSNSVVISQGANGQSALVCVYESPNNHSGTARWFERGRLVRQTRGECPNKLAQIPLNGNSETSAPTWRSSMPPQPASPPNQPSPRVGSRASSFSVQSSSPPSTGLSYGDEKGEITVVMDGTAFSLTSYSNVGSGGFEGRTGGEYQCVELIQRYAGLLTGTTRITGLGNGKDVASNLPSATNGAFEYFGSGSQIAPALGSVISINLTGELAPYGHVGIAQSVQQSANTITVKLFDQNWPTDVRGVWKTVTFSRGADGKWSGVMLNNEQPMSVAGWANPQI